MLVVRVSRTPDAARVEHESVARRVRRVLMVTMPAEDQRLRASGKSAIDRRRGREGQSSINRLLEEILGVAVWRAVNGQHVRVHLKRRRKRAQSFALLRRQRVVREHHARRHLIARTLGDPAVVIPPHRRKVSVSRSSSVSRGQSGFVTQSPRLIVASTERVLRSASTVSSASRFP